MKKILLLLAMCVMLPQMASAQTPTDDTFVVSDLTYDSDLEAYYFIVSLCTGHLGQHNAHRKEK